MYFNTTGGFNTAIGENSLWWSDTGSYNTATGFSTLYNNRRGNYNTAFGNKSLYVNISGDFNTAIGHNAYFTVDNLNNTTCIGNYSGGIINSSNHLEIGNTSVPWIGGQVGWSTYSDARIKTRVQENVPGLTFITRLRPVTYHLDIHRQNELCYGGAREEGDWKEKYDIEKKQMTGFIAQEVEQAAQAVGYNFSGVEKGRDEMGLYSVRYSEFVVPLVKAVQELNTGEQQQNKEMEALKAENSALKAQLESQKAQLDTQAAQLQQITAALQRAGIGVGN